MSDLTYAPGARCPQMATVVCLGQGLGARVRSSGDTPITGLCGGEVEFPVHL